MNYFMLSAHVERKEALNIPFIWLFCDCPKLKDKKCRKSNIILHMIFYRLITNTDIMFGTVPCSEYVTLLSINAKRDFEILG